MLAEQLAIFWQASNHLISFSTWLGSFLIIFFLSLMSVMVYNYSSANNSKLSISQAWSDFTFPIIKKPLLILVFLYLIFIGWEAAQLYLPVLQNTNNTLIATYLLKIIEFGIFAWFILSALQEGKNHLIAWSISINNRVLNILIPAISNSLQAAILLILINMLVPSLGLNTAQALFFEKLAQVLLITVLGWIFFQAVDILEKLIVNQYVGAHPNSITARKIKTQVLILKRVVLAIGMIVTVGAILMVFDSVKNIGTGLLTTAGIVSAVGAFASQQSLGRLFAGLQIAFTQPIRIGDTVIIEHEFGQVEEITLSYIVVKLWDLRRLILPTDYFTSKGIQNLTRESTQLLGTIFLYTDYTLPIEVVRKKFTELLDKSQLWDKKVSAFQVTDIKESTMEIRALVSAENASALWNLRCEIREQLIQFIVQTYPECLSKSRTITTNLVKPTSDFIGN